ncbi:orange carotenoid protein N-terminal domain-containing protein [Okeania sp. SIO2B3]|uniref:orange carotenoid protein N-terminal domain-containing protein n=1 Tax=Okeania sp. SIO2B3 TaxID=2607784 RepID=UPI0013BF6EE9|nr:orange carotenoid protein N-terminal domain-containing protein [Okeania sp. SIO2B3]NET43372.1 orange carotenoid protein [Okeania sp. SIO2B3]
MTYTAESTMKIFICSNPRTVVETTAQFNALSIDEQLALLWNIYTKIRRSVTPATSGAARLQLAEGLLNEIKYMFHEEQLGAIRDLAASKNNPISRAYGILSANTKLAFWYQLTESIEEGDIVPMPTFHQLSVSGSQVLTSIEVLDFGQQITVLRNVVANMGVDPLA